MARMTAAGRPRKWVRYNRSMPKKYGQPDSLPLELIVPVVSAREQTVHDTHEAGAAGAWLHNPLGGYGRRVGGGAGAVGGEPTRRVPGGYGGVGVHAGSDVTQRTEPPTRSSTLARAEPGGDTGSRGDGRPDLSGVPGTSVSTWTERRPDSSTLTVIVVSFVSGVGNRRCIHACHAVSSRAATVGASSPYR